MQNLNLMAPVYNISYINSVCGLLQNFQLKSRHKSSEFYI